MSRDIVEPGTNRLGVFEKKHPLPMFYRLDKNTTVEIFKSQNVHINSQNRKISKKYHSREKKNQVMESKTFTLFVQVTFHGVMLQLLIYRKCRPQENSNEEKGKNFF